MTASKQPRRPNLATIVGSGLAVVAAGSLLAFSSLAEQAGLQGLATGGLQPAQPERDGATHAITVPAPATAPPGDPRDDLTRRVREAVTRVETETAPETTTVTFEPAARRATNPKPKSKPEPSDPGEPTARVAIDEPDAVASDGPPYGHAYGHHKNRDKSKPNKKHESKAPVSEQPVYARKANDEPKAKPGKPPKLQKVEKASKGNGKSNGKSNGKAKGHSKHSHSNGKGKGHSKHGH